MTLFDTHAHYDDEAFDADRDAVLAAFDGLVIDPGCTLASCSEAAVDLAARHPHVYAAVGIHPENCGDFVPEHHGRAAAAGEGSPRWWPSARSALTTTGRRTRPASFSSRCSGPSWSWRLELDYAGDRPRPRGSRRLAWPS